MNGLPFPVFAGFSAEQSLSLWADGILPAAWLEQARAYDREHPMMRTAAVRRGKVTLKKPEIMARATKAIIDAAVSKGCVEERDFEAAGLSLAEVRSIRRDAFNQALASRPGLSSILEVA